MSEVWELGQRFIAALWNEAASYGTDATAAHRLAILVASVAEVEAQLAGLRLHVLNEARLTGAEAVIDEVRHSVRTTPAQATVALKLATELGERFTLIAAALTHGEISQAQAEAIVEGLKTLPRWVTGAELERCQHHLPGHVTTLGPTELRTLASRLVELIDPDAADAEEAKRLAAQERAARRDRFLRISPDFHGSMRITGKLPVADAALLSAQLEALMPAASSYTDQIPSREARRADALVLLTQTAATTGVLPAHGGDRPRVHITLDYETLLSGIGRVGLIGAPDLDGLSPGDARRLACDAGIIPLVLGGASQPLDVGREHRLFTPALRAALVHRDQGCAFPRCTATPATCEAHHIVPWWASGKTSLDNGVLLCPHHHRLVEPDPHQSAQSQWQVHLDPATGLPWFTPPRHTDPQRRPRQHTRHLLQHLPPPDKAPPCPPHTEGDTRIDADLEELFARSAATWT